ncbi:hypothetical protein ACVIN2_003918 [Bradyrhizobium sp. USDA 3650]
MRPGRGVGRPEHGPHGDREQSAGQDRPGDESFPHQAESVSHMNENAPGGGPGDRALQIAAIL